MHWFLIIILIFLIFLLKSGVLNEERKGEKKQNSETIFLFDNIDFGCLWGLLSLLFFGFILGVLIKIIVWSFSSFGIIIGVIVTLIIVVVFSAIMSN